MRPPPYRLRHFKGLSFADAMTDAHDARAYVSALIPEADVLGLIAPHAAALRSETNTEPSLHDVLWRYLNAAYLEHCGGERYGLATGTVASMAAVLAAEEAHVQALHHACRWVYLTESGIATAKGRPALASLEFGGALPGLIGVLEERAIAADVRSNADLAPIFVEAVKMDAHVMQRLKPIGTPNEVWARIAPQMFAN